MHSSSETSPETGAPQAAYSNYFQVGHNAFEFLLDFGQSFSDPEHIRIHTRIIVTPDGAKNLVQTLSESITNYEQTYGPIHREE